MHQFILFKAILYSNLSQWVCLDVGIWGWTLWQLCLEWQWKKIWKELFFEMWALYWKNLEGILRFVLYRSVDDSNSVVCEGELHIYNRSSSWSASSNAHRWTARFSIQWNLKLPQWSRGKGIKTSGHTQGAPNQTYTSLQAAQGHCYLSDCLLVIEIWLHVIGGKHNYVSKVFAQYWHSDSRQLSASLHHCDILQSWLAGDDVTSRGCCW